MTPLFWNIVIVWCLGAVLAVEYADILLEREESQEGPTRRSEYPSK